MKLLMYLYPSRRDIQSIYFSPLFRLQFLDIRIQMMIYEVAILNITAEPVRGAVCQKYCGKSELCELFNQIENVGIYNTCFLLSCNTHRYKYIYLLREHKTLVQNPVRTEYSKCIHIYMYVHVSCIENDAPKILLRKIPFSS